MSVTGKAKISPNRHKTKEVLKFTNFDSFSVRKHYFVIYDQLINDFKYKDQG